MTAHWKPRLVAGLLLVVFLTACASSGKEALGGDGLPVQNPEETYGNAVGDIEGVITLEDNGCWTIDLGDGKRLVVFPAGFIKHESGVVMMSANRETKVGNGDSVVARGGVVPGIDFPGVPDGYWGGYMTFCAPAIEEFVVTDRFLAIDS